MVATMAPVKTARRTTKPARKKVVSAPTKTGAKRVIVILCCPPSKCITFYGEGDTLFFFEREVPGKETPDSCSAIAKELMLDETTLKVQIIGTMANPPTGTTVHLCRTIVGKAQMRTRKQAETHHVWPANLEGIAGRTWGDPAHEAAFRWAMTCVHK